MLCIFLRPPPNLASNCVQFPNPLTPYLLSSFFPIKWLWFDTLGDFDCGCKARERKRIWKNRGWKMEVEEKEACTLFFLHFEATNPIFRPFGRWILCKNPIFKEPFSCFCIPCPRFSLMGLLITSCWRLMFVPVILAGRLNPWFVSEFSPLFRLIFSRFN